MPLQTNLPRSLPVLSVVVQGVEPAAEGRIEEAWEAYSGRVPVVARLETVRWAEAVAWAAVSVKVVWAEADSAEAEADSAEAEVDSAEDAVVLVIKPQHQPN
jgi:hypothetical protein